MSAQWASLVLADAYYKLGELRLELAQPVENPIDEAIKRAMDAIEEADVLLEEPKTKAPSREDLSRAALELRTGFREEDFA